MSKQKDIKYVEELIKDFTAKTKMNKQEDIDELTKRLTALVDEVGGVIESYGNIEDKTGDVCETTQKENESE